mgnify:CR=1 FL=1
MGKYICKQCGAAFKQKSHHLNHLDRKTPCININDNIKNLVDEKVKDEIDKLVPQFGLLSITLTKGMSKQSKKNEGIFFTPYNIIKKSVDFIMEYITEEKIEIMDILEPSCGSCEFIKYINNQFNNVNIDGIEYNKNIYDKIKDINFGKINNVNLLNMDYLKYEGNKYDLITGNPPYFVIKKEDVNKDYLDYFSGRPNIFILFIVHSLFKLKDNGILCFVLPKSFCNCLYYNKLRLFIKNNYTIINIIDCSKEKYIDTGQETIIFILQNKKSENNKYIYDNDGNILFNTQENIKLIEELYKDSTTLEKLDYSVKVGNKVWNQLKDDLTNDNTKTRLIYSGDITDNKLTLTKYKNKEKKNYINIPGNNNPVMLVNRGYGVGKYKLNYCIVDIDKEYLIENHLLVIEYKGEIEKEELLKKFRDIEKSFNNIKTEKFINLYCCNSALNTTELLKILPIF